MNRKRSISISLIALLLIFILFCRGRSICYTNRFKSMTLDILSNPSSWRDVLSDAASEQSVSDESIRELLSGNSRFVHTIENKFEYSGVYLVTKQMFPSKEGILISDLDIDSMPLSRNTGTEIEVLGSANDLFVYRLHYYWD